MTRSTVFSSFFILSGPEMVGTPLCPVSSYSSKIFYSRYFFYFIPRQYILPGYPPSIHHQHFTIHHQHFRQKPSHHKLKSRLTSLLGRTVLDLPPERSNLSSGTYCRSSHTSSVSSLPFTLVSHYPSSSSPTFTPASLPVSVQSLPDTEHQLLFLLLFLRHIHNRREPVHYRIPNIFIRNFTPNVGLLGQYSTFITFAFYVNYVDDL